MNTNELIKQIAQNPELLHSLSPREFEETIAELLSSFGWEVSLTKPTRDGGRDILGVSKDTSGLEVTWFIECKKYRPSHKISVNILRELYGVKFYTGTSNAVLISTSTYTKDARQFAASKRDLHIVSYERIIEWAKQYKPLRDQKVYLSPAHFHTCFISYNHKDEDFAQFLTSRLRQEGIRIWYAPESLLPGKKIHEEIERAIRLFDRLLVVLSDHSMNSEWVKTEIRKARKREIEESRKILFPIGLAPIDQIRKWECFDADIGKDIAVELREYLILDFSNWRNQASFEQQFHKLLRGLVSES